MDNEYKPDLITLIDEQNIEHNFEILDTIENEKGGITSWRSSRRTARNS